MDVKIDPKCGVWGLIWGVVVLDQFCRSGRIVAPKGVLGGVLGGSWLILIKSQDGANFRPKMVPSWNQNGMNIDANID